jgi:three-Cys-motif partner protein
MAIDNFFDESREQSAVKTAIVSKYFDAWANVMISQVKKARDKRIAYLDLFAGPGRYKDGTISTPLKILEKAIAHDDLSQMLATAWRTSA